MAARIKVGIIGSFSSEATRLPTLDVLEIQETFHETPGIETARRWRASAPVGLELTATASRRITHEPDPSARMSEGPRLAPGPRDRYGLFGPTTEVLAAWSATRDLAEALGATAIIFESPTSFGPTAANRDNLYAFFRRAETRLVRAWEPPREWPAHVVERICEDLGLQHANDPFATELVDQPRAYYRLRGPLGRTPRGGPYTADALMELLRHCDDVDEAYVLFGNDSKLEDARRFREIVDQR